MKIACLVLAAVLSLGFVASAASYDRSLEEGEELQRAEGILKGDLGDLFIVLAFLVVVFLFVAIRAVL